MHAHAISELVDECFVPVHAFFLQLAVEGAWLSSAMPLLEKRDSLSMFEEHHGTKQYQTV